MHPPPVTHELDVDYAQRASTPPLKARKSKSAISELCCLISSSSSYSLPYVRHIISSDDNIRRTIQVPIRLLLLPPSLPWHSPKPHDPSPNTLNVKRLEGTRPLNRSLCDTRLQLLSFARRYTLSMRLIKD